MGKIMLSDFSEEEQREMYALMCKENYTNHPELQKLVRQHGLHPSTIRLWKQKLKRKFEDTLQDTKPIDLLKENTDKEDSIDPEEYLYVKGISECINGDGETVLTWTKKDTDQRKRMGLLKKAVKRLVKDIPAREEIVLDASKLELLREDLLVKYPLADMHIGLLAWEKETGENWDCKIAAQYFKEAMKIAVQSSPPARECLILDLGDTIHTDDSSNRTKGHGHHLDVDGRFEYVFDMAVDINVAIIELALQRHEIVRYRKTRGNHDPDMSVALESVLAAYFRENPRVIIERSPNEFWWYRFGNTLHFSTHGHKVKQEKLDSLVPSLCKKEWAEVDFTYADTGHVHHQEVKELVNVVAESYNTLVAKDSYSHSSGYSSLRDLKVTTYHREYGQINRNTTSISMVKKLLGGE